MQRNSPYSGKNNQQKLPNEVQTLGFVDRLKSPTLNISKELKELSSMELKENIRMIAQQIENRNRNQ